MMKISLVYFSATYTTQKIVRQIAAQFDTNNICEYDITNETPTQDVRIEKNELLIVGAPVYSGRIPEKAREAFLRIKGDGSPVVIVGVYGNRAYEDALIEMADILEANGFKVISGAAFIARHSIFSHIATERPDEKDMSLAADYGRQIAHLLHNADDPGQLSAVDIKGNRPYREIGASHAVPILVEENCNECGTCIELCPFDAINDSDPRITDAERCQTCGRCIIICPLQVRHFSGPFFEMVGQKFAIALSDRKEPEIFLP